MGIDTSTWGRVIPAVRDMKDLGAALGSRANAVFLLAGDINTVARAVRAARDAGKQIYLHLDLIEGLGRDRAGVKFVARNIGPDGIISTKGSLIQAAAKEGLYAVQRVFLLDSQSIVTGIASAQATLPDAIECLPGLMPRVIKEMADQVGCPVIAGGLIKQQAEVESALAAGAKAVSVSQKSLWNL